jgi:hypothetical protein
MCQLNERAALLQKIATLRAEGDQQQEIILHAGLEVERLTAEVARLSAVNHLLTAEVEWLRDLRAAADQADAEYLAEIAVRKSEVERLRLRPDEQAAVRDAVLKRLGGGE